MQLRHSSHPVYTKQGNVFISYSQDMEDSFRCRGGELSGAH